MAQLGVTEKHFKAEFSEWDKQHAVKFQYRPTGEPPPQEHRKIARGLLEAVAEQLRAFMKAGWIYRIYEAETCASVVGFRDRLGMVCTAGGQIGDAESQTPYIAMLHCCRRRRKHYVRFSIIMLCSAVTLFCSDVDLDVHAVASSRKVRNTGHRGPGAILFYWRHIFEQQVSLIRRDEGMC